MSAGATRTTSATGVCMVLCFVCAIVCGERLFQAKGRVAAASHAETWGRPTFGK